MEALHLYREKTPKNMGQIHKCARGLRFKITILQWKKRAIFNIVMTYHIIFTTQGALPTERLSHIGSHKCIIITKN
jgi:hypothetical protein